MNVKIIAEAGVNHNGDIGLAKELINIAKDAGADFVKFQSFITEECISGDAPKANYQARSTNENETQYEMVKKLELSEKDHEDLIDYCSQKNISFLSTPFDVPSVHLLSNKYQLPILKIASGEITNSLLLLTIAKTGRPVILSTGMSLLGDIEIGLGILAFGYLLLDEKPCLEAFRSAYLSTAGQNVLKKKVSLLHCTTEYPTAIKDINLSTMDTLSKAFDLPVGFSDHSQGIVASLAAVALGAKIIEKHFTIDKNMEGPDHSASLSPNELSEMIQGIREVERMMGSSKKIPVKSELLNLPIARKSLFTRKAIKVGEIWEEVNLSVKRPNIGRSAIEYYDLLGTIAKKNYAPDESID